MNMLTPKQWRDRSVRVLTVIEKSLDDTSLAPTIEDIGKNLQMSKATVHEALTHMRREGLVTWEEHKMRTLTVTDEGDLLYEEALHVQ